MNGVSSLRVYAREKAPFSIWRKQRRLGATNGEVKMPPDASLAGGPGPADKKDDSALCYHVLDRVRKVWRSNENRTKDYIAHRLTATACTRRRRQGYMELSTTSRCKFDRDMHLVAEFRSAAVPVYRRESTYGSTR